MRAAVGQLDRAGRALLVCRLRRLLQPVGARLELLGLHRQQVGAGVDADVVELRRLPAHQSTPIVLTTAEADDSELLREATRLGVAAVVKKPWTPHKLRLLVEQVVVNPPTG